MTLWCVLVVMNSLLWMPVEAVELETQRGKQSTPGTRATPETNPHDRGDRASESDEYDATTQTPIHDVLNSEPALSAELKHINIPYQNITANCKITWVLSWFPEANMSEPFITRPVWFENPEQTLDQTCENITMTRPSMHFFRKSNCCSS